MTVDQAEVERFSAGLERLAGAGFVTSGRLGLAVSGGVDSLALAVLAVSAMPGRVIAATVDHRLHELGGEWGRQAGRACQTLAIPHRILTVDWGGDPPAANRQARAREARYHLLSGWLCEEGANHLATAHHVDDQAETLLMRLARGAGVSGLAGVRGKRLLVIANGRSHDCLRPLLDFSRSELERIVAAAGLQPVDDPANADPAHDRARVRAFLNATPDWPDRARIAQSAAYLAEADEALDWATQAAGPREEWVDGGWEIDVAALPREIQRRSALAILPMMIGCAEQPRGDVLARALDRLRDGETATLSGIVIRPKGRRWRFEWAPPRRG